MTEHAHTDGQDDMHFQLSWVGWIISVVMLAALIVVIVMNLSEAKHFIDITKHMKPEWLGTAILLQVGTYFCMGGVWRATTKAGGHHLQLQTLARLSIEQLSMNQMMPMGGMAGSLLVIRAMRRRGVPSTLAMEALVVDVFAHYGAFAAVSLLSLLFLWLFDKATSLVVSLGSVLCVILVIVPLGMWLLLKNRTWTPPRFLAKRAIVKQLMNAAKDVSIDRVLSPRLLLKTFALYLGIFALDALTLWVMLQAIGTDVSPITTFIAIVTATIAGTVSFLPGGIGGFEAGCIAALTLLGVSVEAALTGTLLLRGLTLWLPLIPGWILARQELAHHH